MPVTPSAPLDITGRFPELARWARTAVRLHPRLGKPDVRESSLGGPLLWPATEAWPTCTAPHEPPERADHPPCPLAGHYRWVPAEDDGTRLRHGDPAHGLVIGDSGDIYLFTCAACTPRPLAGSAQFG